ncbi:MAG TPA: hypothetical protein VGN12_07960 [Pirellulales bacterium]|jgi:hypothetical protein
MLRLWGVRDFRHPLFNSGVEVIRALTDHRFSERIFGEQVYLQTRSGLRYREIDTYSRSTQNGENHRDICLASFAELGLPLTTPVTIPDGSLSLQDLLRDSIENFDIKQRELAWTAIAYVLYLAPHQEWTNRYGESFTFDDLANALIQTPFRQVSCGGAHLLYAQTILRRVDSLTMCLSDSVREALIQHLREAVIAIVESQHEEGYWTLEWHNALKRSSDANDGASGKELEARLVATGHLLEWLELLPVEDQPSAEVFRRAARWICGTLGQNFQEAKNPDGFCPRVHALCAVRGLICVEYE